MALTQPFLCSATATRGAPIFSACIPAPEPGFELLLLDPADGGYGPLKGPQEAVWLQFAANGGKSRTRWMSRWLCRCTGFAISESHDKLPLVGNWG